MNSRIYPRDVFEQQLTELENSITLYKPRNLGHSETRYDKFPFIEFEYPSDGITQKYLMGFDPRCKDAVITTLARIDHKGNVYYN